jgi:hypothetical protein
MKRTSLKANPDKVRAWQQRSKPLQARTGLKPGTGLKTRTTLKATKSIRKVGKVGKANIASRKAIARTAERMKLISCELGPELIKYGINVCTYNWPLAPAHRHKRAWYKGDEEKLADVKQWVCACQSCHDAIEFDAVLTEAVFKSLRGEE